MTYPGNAALPPDVQGRIVETFEQTLTLAAEGKLQEARLGCDFVLRLDPSYAPAQELTQRLEGASGPLAVADLSPRAAAQNPPAEDMAEAFETVDAASAAPALDEAFEPIDDLDMALPELSPAGPPPAPGAAPGLRQQLQQLLARRDFTALTSLAESQRDAVMKDPECRKLVEVAIERREADPYVSSFIDSARMALQTGEAAEVEALLQKARALDPTHPGIAEIEEAKEHYADPERLMGGRRTAAAGKAPPVLDEGFEAVLSPLEAGGAEAGYEESDPRIAELLGEGQTAFERGELQTAIDAWSRIFLIDIDHQEASRRIEDARRRKAELERKVEELYHDALAKVDARELEPAQALLRQVLELAPNHLSAREALDQLEAGETPRALRQEATAGLDELAELGVPSAEGDELELKEEILVPPEPGQAPRPSLPPPPLGGKAKDSRRTVLLLVSAVLVLGLGWVVYSNWGRLFPNAGEEIPTAPTAPPPSPLERAQALHAEGKTAIAIAQLKRLPPDHADYERAQQLVAGWEKESAPTETAPALPPEEQAKLDRLLEAARRANGERRNLNAVELFERAQLIAPLSDDDQQRYADSQRQVVPLGTLIEYLKVSEYEVALPKLWQLRLDDPENEDVRYLIVTAYFNLGVRHLQRGALDKAREMFAEASQLAPNDAELRRLQLLSQTYQERGEDLLLRIYVKYLPYRQI